MGILIVSSLKSGSFLGANVWRRVIIVDARFKDINRLVLNCLVEKWVQVFDEERSKAKNLLKNKKKSCCQLCALGSKAQDQIVLTNKEIDTCQHWILVSNLSQWTKATDIKTFSWLRFKDKFRQILFLYSRYLESEKTRSGIDRDFQDYFFAEEKITNLTISSGL